MNIIYNGIKTKNPKSTLIIADAADGLNDQSSEYYEVKVIDLGDFITDYLEQIQQSIWFPIQLTTF